jgi:glycosyltransferase involved in cell wall biosynthesis
MKDILLINNKPRGTGIGAYSFSLCDSLKKQSERNIDFMTLNPTSNGDNDSGIKGFPLSIMKLRDHFRFTSKAPAAYKVYHLLSPNLGMMLPKLHPSVVTVHDISVFKSFVIKDIVAKSRGLEIPQLLSIQFNMRFIKKADRILCVSNYTKNDVASVLGVEKKRMTVTYPGLDRQLYLPRDKLDARRSLGLPLNKPVLLHVGTDEPRKNFGTLLEAFRVIKKRVPDAVLVKVGGLREETKKLILDLELKEAVIHHKKVPNAALFYNAADLFVFPSYYEGFGYPVAEAMASGCPVIAADSTSVTEVVGSGGVLFPPFNVAALAETIIQVLADSNRKAALIREGLEQAKKFDWEKCAQATLGVYKTL